MKQKVNRDEERMKLSQASEKASVARFFGGAKAVTAEVKMPAVQLEKRELDQENIAEEVAVGEQADAPKEGDNQKKNKKRKEKKKKKKMESHLAYLNRIVDSG